MTRSLPLALFALAALSPLGLMALGIGRGGLWAAGALVYMTALAAALDQIKGLFAGDAPEGDVLAHRVNLPAPSADHPAAPAPARGSRR